MSSTLIERLLRRDMTLLDGYSPQSRDYTGPDTETMTALRRELDDIDIENPMSLFLIFSAIQQSQFTEAVPWILDSLLSQSSYSGSYCDPEARLFMHAELPIEMVTFVVDAASSRFSLAAVIDSLISLDSNDEVYNACSRALLVLGDTDFPSWVNFANEADVQGNSMVWLFCQHQARRTAPFSTRPQYMKEFTERSLEVSAPKLELVEGESYEDLIKKRSRDPELFRVWGPANLQFAAAPEDVLDGSADLRMFVDDRFTPEEQGTWFTGSCDQCWLRIKSPRYAVRRPLESGGWKGQYCSWDCVRIDCGDYEPVSREMTFYYEKQCLEFGVYDHIFALRGELLGDKYQPDEDTMPLDRPIVQ